MSNQCSREVSESPICQSPGEQIAYSVDFTKWGIPSAPSVAIYDGKNIDVSDVCLLGTATISGKSVITPKVVGLEARNNYTLVVSAQINGNLKSCKCRIICDFP